jgi:Spy/CpxP family protein refolding chaperone
MKTFFIWIMAGLSICMNTTAQMGMGGNRGMGRGGYGGNRGGRYGGIRSTQSQTISKDYNQLSITYFPEITGLTLKQKLEVSTIVTDEQKNILKLKDQKQELQVKIDHADSQKETDKYKKKMAKLDEKMQQVSLKADGKIRTILTNDQYKEFSEKKSLIKFDMLPKFGSGFRPNSTGSQTDMDRNNMETRERPY